MTIGKWSLCIRWSSCRGSPGSISLACFKQEELTKLLFISFSNANGFAFENSLDSGYPFVSVIVDVQRQGCWIRGSGNGQRLINLWDNSTTEQSFNAGEVRRSPELSARLSVAAKSENRQLCATCLFAESVGL